MRTIIAALLAACALGASAATQEIETTASGYGKTEGEALGDALARAVTQVTGGGAGLSTRVERATAGVATVNSEGKVSSAQLNASRSASADFRGGGQVARYTVLSTAKKPDGNYETRIRAWIVRYEAPTRTGALNRIAVLPVGSSGESLDLLGRVSAAALGEELGRALESSLLGAGSFQVLDRKTLDVAVRELSLDASGLASPAEKAKLQNMRGVDFLVIPSLAVDSAGAKVNPATGQRQSDPDAVRLLLRVIVPATSELAFSDSFPIHTKGYQKRNDLIRDTARRAAMAIDTGLLGKSALAGSAVPESRAEPPPKADEGVKLPFDR